MEREFKKLFRKSLKTSGENMDVEYGRSTLIRFIEIYMKQTEKTWSKSNQDQIAKIIEKMKSCILSKEKMKLESSLDLAIEELVAQKKEQVDGLTIGAIYEYLNTISMKKGLGQVYTPEKVVDYIVEETIKLKNFSENPNFKILDPSCGSGFFLIKVFRKLRDIVQSNAEDIVELNHEFKWRSRDSISKHIIKNNIYGVEKDLFSALIAELSLIIESKVEFRPNISCQDILIEDYPLKFNLIVGNPPYIGVKNLEKAYREKLRKKYHNVYEDKSDISYCFFERGNELLLENGKIEILTSRYFLEALYAKKLRRYILSQYSIEKIVDFYGENIFKGISISPLIIKLKKGGKADWIDYCRPEKKRFKLKEMDIGKFKVIKVSSRELSEDRWIMKDLDSIRLFKKIENRGDIYLKELADSSQGIITGLDKAFIVENISEIPIEERHILKFWIKNSDIERYRAIDSDKYIIYTELIENIEDYPIINEKMKSFKAELQNRRECVRGSRKWYEIQWVRDRENFNKKRVIFPYKASKNRFAMVDAELYHSADIYCIKLKEGMREMLSTEYLLGFLNSKLFEYYFKTIAKKLNRSIYEYYPNKIMNLKIKLPRDKKEETNIDRLISEMVREKAKRDHLSRKIDSYFFKLYDLTDSEVELILKTV